MAVCSARSFVPSLGGQSLRRQTAIASSRQPADLLRAKPPDLCMRQRFSCLRLHHQGALATSKSLLVPPIAKSAIVAKSAFGIESRRYSHQVSARPQRSGILVRSAPIVLARFATTSRSGDRKPLFESPALRLASETKPLLQSPTFKLAGQKHRRLSAIAMSGKWWKRWSRRQDSDLHKDRPPGLPLTMKDIEPLPPEEMEARLNCDVETETCKKPLFSFTGECKRCQGTGLVSFYRKNGKEVISNCITCQGVGYVQRITSRGEAVALEDLEKPKR